MARLYISVCRAFERHYSLIGKEQKPVIPSIATECFTVSIDGTEYDETRLVEMIRAKARAEAQNRGIPRIVGL